MAWKRQSTSKSVDIDVELDEFDECELLQALIDARWISEDEAFSIKARASSTDKKSPVLTSGPDAEELAEANYCIRRGMKGEAIIHLERFLGRDWIGALQ